MYITGNRVLTPLILTSTADGGDWLTARPGCSSPLDTDPGNYQTGGSVDHRCDLDVSERIKISCLWLYRTPDRPTRSLVSIKTTQCSWEPQIEGIRVGGASAPLILTSAPVGGSRRLASHPDSFALLETEPGTNEWAWWWLTLDRNM